MQNKEIRKMGNKLHVRRKMYSFRIAKLLGLKNFNIYFDMKPPKSSFLNKKEFAGQINFRSREIWIKNNLDWTLEKKVIRDGLEMLFCMQLQKVNPVS